jgi:hypothetical protein
MLHDISVPLGLRLDCIEAMETLFTRYFAVRCTPHWSHLDRAETGTPAYVSPLNGVCYLWWDILPLHGLSQHRPDLPDGPVLDEAIFSVIKHCLMIDSVACQESAIIGLMEWSPYYAEIGKIAEDFLNQNPGIPPELSAWISSFLVSQ